jgi:hypothetical protein
MAPAPPPPTQQPADDSLYGIVTPMAPEPEYSDIHEVAYGGPVFPGGSLAPQQDEENIYGMVPGASEPAAVGNEDLSAVTTGKPEERSLEPQCADFLGWTQLLPIIPHMLVCGPPLFCSP